MSLHVRLFEWTTVGPDELPELAGRNLAKSASTLCEVLARTGRLTILQLAKGLQISATSWVGRLEIDGITITIDPKLPETPLGILLGYAYSLGDVHLRDTVTQNATPLGFRDVLVYQLVGEVEEIITRGLQRDYAQVRMDLPSPRGRIDFDTLVRGPIHPRAVLPCQIHPRIENNPLNATLLAGLGLGQRLASDMDVRRKAARLAQLLSHCGSSNQNILVDFAEVEARMDRRHRPYEAAMRIIRLLIEGRGISLEPDHEELELPGFLFDMNRFFQRLIGKLLVEDQTISIHNEYQLHDVFEWRCNPLKRRVPTPRPDFAIFSNERLLAILDAKYRDLWERPLPRDMLYQLALYAVGTKTVKREATIIYPVMRPGAQEQVIDMRDPVSGGVLASVILRPVNLLDLATMLHQHKSLLVQRKCARLANHLAFGSKHETYDVLHGVSQ